MLSAGAAEEYDKKTFAALIYKQRRKILEASGLDINSCLQLLLDLYSQWARNEVFCCLNVLVQFIVGSCYSRHP